MNKIAYMTGYMEKISYKDNFIEGNRLYSTPLYEVWDKALTEADDDMSIRDPYAHADNAVLKSKILKNIIKQHGKPVEIMGLGNTEGIFKIRDK